MLLFRAKNETFSSQPLATALPSGHGAVLADKPSQVLAIPDDRRSCVLGKPRWRGCNWGWTVKLRPSTKSRLGVLGDTDTGDVVTHLTLPFRKLEGGSSEGLNLSPTGGRQHVGDGMSSNERTQGDDLGLTGAVVLHGATWADRRIAQASKGRKNCGYGVVGSAQGRVMGVSGQNSRDIVRPSRDVDSVSEGKPRVRNICGAKGLRTDCTANRSHMLVGLHLREIGQREWITWEAPGVHQTLGF